MARAALWIAELWISDRTAAKIRGVHGLDPSDVRDALVCRVGLPYRWDEHPERGLRAIVQTKIGGELTLAVLYPIGDDTYHLGSAYPLHS